MSAGIDPRDGRPADYLIGAELGEQHGGNLFHSFESFGIGTGETATFTGPDAVENVISRVTGGDASAIDGTLRSSIPGADVYLFNPSGVAFGPNAKLDLQGSFHASTADRLELADGEVIEARPAPLRLLATAPPASFGFLESNTALITVEGSTFLMPEGGSFFLDDVGRRQRIVGGDVVTDPAQVADREFCQPDLDWWRRHVSSGRISAINFLSSSPRARSSNTREGLLDPRPAATGS